jgi:adenylate cyclase
MTLYDFKKKYLPLLVRAGIGLGIGVLVLLVTQGYLLEIGLLKDIDLLTVDYRIQSHAASGGTKDVKNAGDVVIVEINDKDLEALPEKFPFPRSYYGHLVENLNRAGARVIAFDMTFTDKGTGDSAFADVMRRFDNVVLAAKLQTGTSTAQYEIRSTEQNYKNIFFGVNRNIGIVNVPKDRDDVCREYFPMVLYEEQLTPSLAFAALNRVFKLPPLTHVKATEGVFTLKDRDIPRYSPSTFMLSYYGPVRTFRYVPFSQVIDDSTFQTKDELDLGADVNAFEDPGFMNLFRNKVVIVGSTMAEERDYHNTPLYVEEGGKKNHTMYGVEIHATAVQNVLDRTFITRMDPVLEALLIFLFAIGGFFGFHALKQIHLKRAWLLEIGVFGVVVVLIAAIMEAGILVFDSSSVMMSVVNPSVALILAYVGTAVYQYLEERQQKSMIKNVFSHYINPAVVNELIANPEKASLGGDRRELTVFFSDIAAFTTISERFHAHPEGLVELLNEYLDEMTAIVLKYEGTLDKYEGDAIMAFWGAPIPQKDHALRACLAALEMQKRLTVLRTKWKRENKPELEVRCGLNTGIMIVGNMGGKDRFDYTVIGDSVNLASRLEGANKQYGSSIMISDMTYQQVKGKIVVRELDLIQVKGKTEPVKVFEVLGTTDAPMTDQQQQALEMYNEGLKAYRERKWEEAIAYMQQTLKLDPKFYVAQIYTERANLYQITPPPAEWNGVFVMKTK